MRHILKLYVFSRSPVCWTDIRRSTNTAGDKDNKELYKTTKQKSKILIVFNNKIYQNF